MKKVGIITIFDNNNYGNRLQNYAVQTILNNNGYEGVTIKNDVNMNNNINKIEYIKIKLKYYYRKIKNKVKNASRYRLFCKFNKNIKLSKSYFCYLKLENIKDYDYFVVGSDQVWNPYFYRLSDFDLLNFIEDSNKKISFSASFGISNMPKEYEQKTTKALKEFKAISVREEEGKKIVEKLTGRTDVEVLIDPTMMLDAKDWDKVLKKPKQLKTDKYILNYFLGELPEEKKKEIDRIAKENECEVINILDKNSPFYQTGPAEFLYLEKNAFLICTDSFHSCVFAILYNRPFIVFEREDKNVSMNSRIETLLNKFELQDRRFKGNITEENLKWNYEDAYKVLKNEKIKAKDFLKKAFEIRG